MTESINGIGTQLIGARALTKGESNRWLKEIRYHPHITVQNYLIATEAFCIIFPIFPIKTFVFHYVTKDKYCIDYFPAGEDNVYWAHVKNSFEFYILPAGLVLLGLYFLITAII